MQLRDALYRRWYRWCAAARTADEPHLRAQQPETDEAASRIEFDSAELDREEDPTLSTSSLNAFDDESSLATLCSTKALSEDSAETTLAFVEVLRHNMVMFYSDQEPVLVQLLKTVQNRCFERTFLFWEGGTGMKAQWILRQEVGEERRPTNAAKTTAQTVESILVHRRPQARLDDRRRCLGASRARALASSLTKTTSLRLNAHHHEFASASSSKFRARRFFIAPGCHIPPSTSATWGWGSPLQVRTLRNVISAANWTPPKSGRSRARTSMRLPSAAGTPTFISRRNTCIELSLLLRGRFGPKCALWVLPSSSTSLSGSTQLGGAH